MQLEPFQTCIETEKIYQETKQETAARRIGSEDPAIFVQLSHIHTSHKRIQ